MVSWNFDGDIDQILLTDDNVSDSLKKCILDGFVDAEPEFSGGIGTRIASIFVILVTSTLVTFLPILCKDFNFKIPLYAYLFARYFGAGVIIATAFVHLMDPAYGAIGPDTCIGGWGNWSVYSWPPALMLLSIFSIFIIELVSEVYVERKYGTVSSEPNIEQLITGKPNQEKDTNEDHHHQGLFLHNHDNSGINNIQEENIGIHTHSTHNSSNSSNSNSKRQTNNKLSNELHRLHPQSPESALKVKEANLDHNCFHSKTVSSTILDSEDFEDEDLIEINFKRQIAAFLVLEFGVIFHSVIIGLNLGSTEYDEFKTLFIVLVFHQSFEGLGIGARLSAIPWPKSKPRWISYALCSAYGLVTPISIAIGLGVRNSYASSSFTALIVSGILDSLSAGILIYTGLVEMLARDFVFNEDAKKDLVKLSFNVFCTLLGCFIMALLGKWA